jgi:hypothetical protein
MTQPFEGRGSNSVVNHIFEAAPRLPSVPSADEIPADERAAYEYHVRRTDAFKDGDVIVDGKSYGVAHFEALLVSPPVAAAISGRDGLGRAARKYEGKPGHFSAADHELVDLVLAFDSGYLGLVAGHTPWAIEAGVRIECIEALAENMDSELTTEERQVVEFIRAVRDGLVTDEMWWGIRERFGTDRGVVDYVALILTLFFHHRFCWALGVPEMRREDFRTMLEEYKDGTRNVEHLGKLNQAIQAAR